MSYKDSEMRGEKAENLFKSLIIKNGLKIINANTNSNKLSHYDFKIEYNNRNYRVDVKAQKKVSRSSNELSNRIWIEFKGIKGQPGWLFGQADFIAFEIEEKFILISRLELIDIVEKKVDMNNKVHSATDALYSIYTRNNREDVLSMIEMKDLDECLSKTVLDFDNLDKSFFDSLEGEKIKTQKINISSLRSSKSFMDAIKRK